MKKRGIFKFVLVLLLFVIAVALTSYPFIANWVFENRTDSLVCLLGIWILADFNGFWTTFHQVFFSNDLWLLNPYTDLMINLFPEAFFNHLVVRIILWFLAFYVPAALIAIVNQRTALMLRFCPGALTRDHHKEA